MWIFGLPAVMTAMVTVRATARAARATTARCTRTTAGATRATCAVRAARTAGCVFIVYEIDDNVINSLEIKNYFIDFFNDCIFLWVNWGLWLNKASAVLFLSLLLCNFHLDLLHHCLSSALIQQHTCNSILHNKLIILNFSWQISLPFDHLSHHTINRISSRHLLESLEHFYATLFPPLPLYLLLPILLLLLNLLLLLTLLTPLTLLLMYILNCLDIFSFFSIFRFFLMFLLLLTLFRFLTFLSKILGLLMFLVFLIGRACATHLLI
ncbi:unnamed protein product [Moneuplotes crassus]|uniref:Uncharacterized protein n=1 Tax=Euplotes crassus TaxID=5936 RepID=A0AAD1XTI7_EUPCR|nr:unnamed protein product [Moneuplotes crassus]